MSYIQNTKGETIATFTDYEIALQSLRTVARALGKPVKLEAQPSPNPLPSGVYLDGPSIVARP